MNIHTNFSLIKEEFPIWGVEAEIAEGQIGKDNVAASTHYRRYLEGFVNDLIVRILNEDIQRYKNYSLFDRLDFIGKNFRAQVPSAILTDCHSIRISGNLSCHLSEKTVNTVTETVLYQNNERAFRIGQWMLQKIGRNDATKIAYIVPAPQASEQTLPTQALALRHFYPGLSLNADQTKAVAALQAFLENDNQKVFALYGYAGTGKTTLLKGVYEYLVSTGRTNTWLLAPTGKAANVLALKTGLAARTLHSHIYTIVEVKRTADSAQKPMPRFEGRLKTLTPGNKNPILIIDEASMLGDDSAEEDAPEDDPISIRFGSGRLLKDLFTYSEITSESFSGKIIFVGDEAQLPPIGLNVSPAFDFSYLKQEYGINASSYQLTEVVRQKSNNSIVKLANELHKAIDVGNFSRLSVQSSENIIREVKENIIQVFDRGWRSQPKKPVSIIARTNADVHLFNRMIRKQYFKSADAPLQPRDRLMVYRTVRQGSDAFFNGEELQVAKTFPPEVHWVAYFSSAAGAKKAVRHEKKLVFLPVEFSNHQHPGVFYLLENYLNTPGHAEDADLARALFEDFKKRNPSDLYSPEQIYYAKTKDPFLNCLWVKYGYALTCHKAQGSEWPWVVVVSDGQHNGNADFFRWYYTAVTRASERLFVVNEPHITPYKLQEISNDWEPIFGNEPEENEAKVVDLVNISLSDTVLKNDRQRLSIPDTGVVCNIFNQIRKLISPDVATIVQVKHHPYLEIYIFADTQGNPARIDLHYSKKKISQLDNQSKNILGQNIMELLSPLSGIRLDVLSAHPDRHVDLGNPELNKFLDLLKEHGASKGLKIILLRHIQYRFDILVTRGEHRSVVYLIYNGKYEITKYKIDRGPESLNQIIRDIFAEIQRK